MKDDSHKITAKDLYDIISTAAGKYPTATIPMILGETKLSHGESVNVLLLETFIGYLNKNGLLTKMVDFDHKKRK